MEPVEMVHAGFVSMLLVSRFGSDPRVAGYTGEHFATLIRMSCQKDCNIFVGLNSTLP